MPEETIRPASLTRVCDLAESTDRVPFRLQVRIDGCLSIEDLGLIGNGPIAAPDARDGAVEWLCVPRFDAPLLPPGARGLDRVSPGLIPDTGVLITELTGRGGMVRIVDPLTFRAGADLIEGTPAERGELLRRVTILGGPRVVAPRGDRRGAATGITRRA